MKCLQIIFIALNKYLIQVDLTFTLFLSQFGLIVRVGQSPSPVKKPTVEKIYFLKLDLLLLLLISSLQCRYYYV